MSFPKLAPLFFELKFMRWHVSWGVNMDDGNVWVAVGEGFFLKFFPGLSTGLTLTVSTFVGI